VARRNALATSVVGFPRRANGGGNDRPDAWRATLERVIDAQMRRDATRSATPERQLADQEYETAMAASREVDNPIRCRSV
jgi:hypothetical protein